jgi:hypothetical protein
MSINYLLLKEVLYLLYHGRAEKFKYEALNSSDCEGHYCLLGHDTMIMCKRHLFCITHYD